MQNVLLRNLSYITTHKNFLAQNRAHNISFNNHYYCIGVVHKVDIIQSIIAFMIRIQTLNINTVPYVYLRSLITSSPYSIIVVFHLHIHYIFLRQQLCASKHYIITYC